MLSYIKSISAFILILVVFSACEEDKVFTHEFTEQQIAAKNLAGSWGEPFNVVTPATIPATVLDKVIVLFTVDDQGNPSGFLADNAEDVFSSDAGTWAWAEGGTTTDIVLTGVEPISSIKVVMETLEKITLSFEVTTVGGRASAIGSYQVSLVKI